MQCEMHLFLMSWLLIGTCFEEFGVHMTFSKNRIKMVTWKLITGLSLFMMKEIKCK